MAGLSLSWEVQAFLRSLSFVLQDALQVISQGHGGVWGLQILLPKDVMVWICPEQDAEWSQRFCADFAIFLRMGVAIHNRSKERVISWENWKGLWGGSRETGSVCSSLILILQRQETGLEIEPDSQFRETSRYDFLIEIQDLFTGVKRWVYSMTFLQFNFVTHAPCRKIPS